MFSASKRATQRILTNNSIIFQLQLPRKLITKISIIPAVSVLLVVLSKVSAIIITLIYFCDYFVMNIIYIDQEL